MLQGVHFLGIRSRTTLTHDTFEVADKLVAVGCYCIGTNQVDLAGQQHMALLFLTRLLEYAFSRWLVLAEAILLLRGIPEKSAQAHRGGWAKTPMIHSRFAANIGIVGRGRLAHSCQCSPRVSGCA